MSHPNFLFFYLGSRLVPSLGLPGGEIQLLVPKDTVFPHGTRPAVPTPRPRTVDHGRDTPVFVTLWLLLLCVLNVSLVSNLFPQSWHLLPLIRWGLTVVPDLLSLWRMVVEELAPILVMVVTLGSIPAERRPPFLIGYIVIHVFL